VKPSLVGASRTKGLCYASTDDGLELPIVDTTHPAFQESADADRTEATIAATMESIERYEMLTDAERRAMAAGSVLIRGMLAAADTYMSGIMTYLYKLGPANMAASWATDVDRAVAAGVAASMDHVVYDWSDVSVLRRVLADTITPNSLFVASSEGGLFEYPSDVHIIENLRVLRAGAPSDARVVGTVVCDTTTLDRRLHRGRPCRVDPPSGSSASRASSGWPRRRGGRSWQCGARPFTRSCRCRSSIDRHDRDDVERQASVPIRELTAPGARRHRQRPPRKEPLRRDNHLNGV
jgi:hypothetical protein